MKIIDSHSHLGDILYPDGGTLIWKKGLAMPAGIDIVSYNEAMLQRSFGLGEILYGMVKYWATKVERARNAAATLENMSASLDVNGISHAVCLPIAPNLTYDDLAMARRIDGRILPFTSIDYSLGLKAFEKLEQDIEDGALGLKLHPIIQRKRLDDPLLLEILHKFANFNKPVLTHAGLSYYYLGEENKVYHAENGGIDHVKELVSTFPKIKFIIGHAGLFQSYQVCKKLKEFDNIWVDTSFQSPENIRKLIEVFGAEKVMYGSDWPYGYCKPNIKAVKVACRGDRALEEMLFYQNAATLLGVE